MLFQSWQWWLSISYKLSESDIVDIINHDSLVDSTFVGKSGDTDKDPDYVVLNIEAKKVTNIS